MQKTLHALIELQDLDDKLDELLAERGDLPHIVTELEEKLNNKKKKNDSLDEEVTNSKVRIKELESLIEGSKAKLKKYNDQLYQVKTNREYDAITTEIESVQEVEKQYKQEISDLNSNIEEKVSLLSELETDISNINEELSENQVELDSRLAETADEENKLNSERSAVIKKLSQSVLKTYETIREARGGKGIAKVENGNCGGCFSYIPPQKIVEIRKMKKMYECEFCGRILVWSE